MVVSVLVDNLGRIVVSSMHDSVAGNGNVFLLGDCCKVLVVDQLIQHVLEGIVLGGDLLIKAFPLGYRFRASGVLKLGWWSGKTIDLGFCQLAWFVALVGAVNGDWDGA